MSFTKPTHLSAAYAAQFQQPDIAQAYHARPPYPSALFELLSSLVPEHACVLELGAGTGDLTLGLAERCERLEALEPSAAMLEIARARAATRPIVWHACSAEAFAFAGPYALVVAAESLHWMEWEVVLPKVADALTQAGQLAIVAERKLTVAWSSALRELVGRFSTNRDYQPYHLLELLEQRGLFDLNGRQTLRSAFTQSADDYIESFHSRNGLSRERMGVASAQAFDAALRGMLAEHGASAHVQAELSVEVAWGRPSPGQRMQV